MNKRLILLFAFFFLLFTFYVLSVEVKKGKFNKINFDITSRIQYKISDRVGGELEDLTFFADPTSSVVLVGLLTIVACIDIKKRRFRFKGLIIPLAFLLLVSAEVFGKNRVESPAPPFFMIKNPTTIFPKYHVIDQYSYPSGHAERALFMAGVLIMLGWKTVKNKFGVIGVGIFILCGVFFVLAVSIGKIYLGQHWVSDIMGGWTLALAFLSFLLAFE